MSLMTTPPSMYLIYRTTPSSVSPRISLSLLMVAPGMVRIIAQSFFSFFFYSFSMFHICTLLTILDMCSFPNDFQMRHSELSSILLGASPRTHFCPCQSCFCQVLALFFLVSFLIFIISLIYLIFLSGKAPPRVVI